MTSLWSTEPYHNLYDAILEGNTKLKDSLIEILSPSLLALLNVSGKSDSSRKTLESGKLTFTNGQTYNLNQPFIEGCLKLSDELQIDEVIAAEIFYFSSSNEFSNSGTSYLDTAVAAYYNIRDFILKIVSFYLCSSNRDAKFTKNNQNQNSDSNSLIILPYDKKFLIEKIKNVKNFSNENILKSYEKIEEELKSIKIDIEGKKLLGAYNVNTAEMKRIHYRREIIYNQHQMLSEILYGYIITFSCDQNVFSVDQFCKILNHVASFEPQDIFALSYIPGLFSYVSNLDQLSDATIENLQRAFQSDVENIDKLAESPLKSLIILVFLSSFIEWCKKDNLRVAKFDFLLTVDEPMQKCISAGALEQFLSIAADTSLIELKAYDSIEPFYDFRTFLQQHIPKYLPVRLFDIDETATSKLKNSLQQQKMMGKEIQESEYIDIYSVNTDFKLNSDFVNFLVPILSNFIHLYISVAAFMMTQLRDAEEDFLISAENFELEKLAENADLERLYISMYYIYSGRPEYCAEFWADQNSASYGFLQWGSRCNSPLIMATFSMVLASLASGESNAIEVFGFLQLTNNNNNNGNNATTLLASNREGLTFLTKFSSVSWSTIYSTLMYYNDTFLKAKESFIQKFPETTMNSDLKSKRSVTTELGEDSIIYLSGFFQILANVAKNNSKARIELLESDKFQLLTILTNLLNMSTSLSGSIVSLLSSLVGDTYTERCKFWQILDNWLFHDNRYRTFNGLYSDCFSNKLTSAKLEAAFIGLIIKLLQPLNSKNDPSEPLSFSFPENLGSTFRKPGIWCYINHICFDVLPEMDFAPTTDREKKLIQFSILELMELCLLQLDPDLILNASSCHIKNIDNITKQKSIIHYFQCHPGSAVLVSMYNNNVYGALFKFCNIGIDQVSSLQDSSIEIKLLEKSLKVIQLTLDREKFLIDELLSILRLPDNLFCDPSDVGLSGLNSFYEAFLLNLPLIANISLYVGTNKLEIVNLSLSIISKIASSTNINDYKIAMYASVMDKNHLLLMYETVDESIRIRTAFIEQFESPILNANSIGTKIKLLHLINNNLYLKNMHPTISHFLLGFNTRPIDLGLKNEETTILSEKSLLKSIIIFLKTTVAGMIDVNNIDYSLIRMCALCMEILLKLCKSDLTTKHVLQYLRTGGTSASSACSDSNFILFLIEKSHKVLTNILFSSQEFDGNVSLANQFCRGDSMCALNAFISFRCSLVQLISIEIHMSTMYGSISLSKKYLAVLTHSFGFSSGTSKLLNLLDILDFKTKNMIEEINKVYKHFDYAYILRKIQLKDQYIENNLDFPYDFVVLDNMVDLFIKEQKTAAAISTKTENIRMFLCEKAKLKELLTLSISYDNFKLLSFKYLSYWTLLVQVMIRDINMQLSERINLVFEIFQYTVPKIEDYFEADIKFAECLVSLSVHLFQVYKNDKKELFNTLEERETNAYFDFDRLYPIFKMATRGISLSQSTPTLRSDLYVLINNYFEEVIINDDVIVRLGNILKSLDIKVFEIICEDSLIGESTNRITSLILLESFGKIVLRFESLEDFILDTFCKENYLRLLVQKLKITDENFSKAIDNYGTSGITIQELFYELTVFKSTISFFVRIAQIRLGAQQLLRNDIFGVIRECKFLKLDAELGFDLQIKENSRSGTNENYVSMSVTLDIPLGSNFSRNSGYSGKNTLQETISYYEILIPVFQLINTIVISLGPKNTECISQATSVEKSFKKLITSVIKREILYEKYYKNGSMEAMNDSEAQIYTDANVKGIKELSKLFTLLNTLL